MLKSLSKRVLSASLAFLTALSMFPTTALAEEAEDIILLEEEESEAEAFSEAEEDEEILVEEPEGTEDSAEIDITGDTAEDAENTDKGGEETALEYYVAPGYEGVYTEADVEDYFENEYVVTEEDAEFEATSEDIKAVLKRRETKYTYTDTSFNAKALIEGALVDTNETDPTSGDYIKGNLIGYSAGGHGYGSNWTINITFMYASYSDPAGEEKQVNDKVAQIKKSLNLTSSELSDYDKVKLIDDYLQKTITYTNDGTYGCHGTYAALVKGKCVCQGYSTAFLRLTREAGVASKYITGMQIDHAWNIVRVKGGTDPERSWYNNDTTWGRFLENDIEFLDHPRDKEYATDSYKKKHPISRYNWGKNTAGMDEDNKAFNFNSIDGLPMTSTVDSDSKRPKIMVFYHYGDSNKSNYPAQILKSFEQHKILKNKKIEVYAIDVNSDQDAVKSYVKSNNFGSSIRFASFNKDSTDAFAYYGGYYSPYVVMIDENNRVQFANNYSGEFITKKFANYVWDTFMYYLVAEWDHTAVIKSITLDKSTASLNNGDSDTLTVSYNPEKTCDDKTITWTSSDESVVTVTPITLNTATITATGSGVATVTAKCMDKTATCRVTTFTPITGVTIVPEDQAIYVGEATLFTAVVSPKKSDVVGGYTWKDENSEVVSLTESASGDSVTVLGKKSGITNISVAVDGYTATRQITVLSSDISLDYQGGTPGKTDPETIKGVYGQPIGALPSPSYEDHVFLGWYTGKNCAGIKVSESTAITRSVFGDSFLLYAGYREVTEGQFTILPVADQTYEGAALKPEVTVYLGDKLLTSGKDYTVKYSNNTTAYALTEGTTGFSESAAPTVTVKGKGNFTGTSKAFFRILPKNLADADVVVDEAGLYMTATGSTLHAAPKVKFGKKALKAGTDFDFTYPDTEQGDYIKAGQNTVIMTAKAGGNFTGSRSLIQTIARSDLSPISKCKITVGKSYAYTGDEIIPDVIVKSGKIELTKGRDYKLILSNNKEIGTATVIVTGIGGFTGNKKFTFKITGTDLSKADITLSATSFAYDGTAHEPVVTVRAKKNDPVALKEGEDYIVSFTSNVNKGKATVKVTGVGSYTGTARKTFNITAADINRTEITFTNTKTEGVEPYVKGGVIPVITVKDGEKVLTAGIDYTLKVTNNNKVFNYTGDATKAPTVTVTGKGNYSGKKQAFFSIVAGKLQTRKNVTAIADDVVYSSKPGKWKSKVTIYDSNGKKLEAGKDYDKNIKFTYADTGLEVGAADAPAAGTRILYTVTGINNYEGTLLEKNYDYRIVEADKHIGKGITFKIADKQYTGTDIHISKSDITFDAKGKTGFDQDCFEIFELPFADYISKGSPKVILWGNPDKGYGGMKIVSYKITPKVVN